MAKPIPMTKGKVMNPPDMGTKHKWKFKNETEEPIHDFFLGTGPKSFLEIEWCWGETGNPPDIRKFTIREDGFEDGSKSFDDVTAGKATLDPPIEPGKEFEIEMEFDDNFEPKEYFIIIPTDANGVTISGDDETETAEPNTGTSDLLEALGKMAGSLKEMNIPLPKFKSDVRFDDNKQQYVLSFVPDMKRAKVSLQVVHVNRKHTIYNAHYGLDEKKHSHRKHK